MKIGILTYHRVANFGANLQAMSTYGWLKMIGHEPVVIDYYPADLEACYASTPAAQLAMHESFFHHHFHHTKRCGDEASLLSVIQEEELQGVVIGSDAILSCVPAWGTWCVSRRGLVRQKRLSVTTPGNPFWASFAHYLPPDFPVIMLSGSGQNTFFPYFNPHEIRSLGAQLKHFKYITVRDRWTQRMVRYLTGGNLQPPICPDPVFAFNHHVSALPGEADIRSRHGLEGDYLLVSFRSQEVDLAWLKALEAMAAASGTTCVALPLASGMKFQHPFKREISLPLDPLDWYALIRHARGYVGHNMHPMIVAIHNAVPFFIFDYYRLKWLGREIRESSKIFDVLQRLGLESFHCPDRGAGKRRATPEFVWKKIMEFDRELCRAKAVFQQQALCSILESELAPALALRGPSTPERPC